MPFAGELGKKKEEGGFLDAVAKNVEGAADFMNPIHQVPALIGGVGGGILSTAKEAARLVPTTLGGIAADSETLKQSPASFLFNTDLLENAQKFRQGQTSLPEYANQQINQVSPLIGQGANAIAGTGVRLGAEAASAATRTGQFGPMQSASDLLKGTGAEGTSYGDVTAKGQLFPTAVQDILTVAPAARGLAGGLEAAGAENAAGRLANAANAAERAPLAPYSIPAKGIYNAVKEAQAGATAFPKLGVLAADEGLAGKIAAPIVNRAEAVAQGTGEIWNKTAARHAAFRAKGLTDQALKPIVQEFEAATKDLTPAQQEAIPVIRRFSLDEINAASTEGHPLNGVSPEALIAAKDYLEGKNTEALKPALSAMDKQDAFLTARNEAAASAPIETPPQAAVAPVETPVPAAPQAQLPAIPDEQLRLFVEAEKQAREAAPQASAPVQQTPGQEALFGPEVGQPKAFEPTIPSGPAPRAAQRTLFSRNLGNTPQTPRSLEAMLPPELSLQEQVQALQNLKEGGNAFPEGRPTRELTQAPEPNLDVTPPIQRRLFGTSVGKAPEPPMHPTPNPEVSRWAPAPSPEAQQLRMLDPESGVGHEMPLTPKGEVATQESLFGDKVGKAPRGKTQTLPEKVAAQQQDLAKRAEKLPTTAEKDWNSTLKDIFKHDIKSVREGLGNTISDKTFSKAIEGMDSAKSTNFVAKLFDEVTATWKTGVLPFNPAWQVGNVVSNAVTAMTHGGVDPVWFRENLGRIKAEINGEGELGGGSLGHTQASEFLDRAPAKTAPGKAVRKLSEKAYALNERVDNYSHAAVALKTYDDLIAEGVPHNQAIDMANKRGIDVMGDFANMSEFEKNTVRRIVPFYTWAKHATKMSLREAMNNPVRQLRLAALQHVAAAPTPQGSDYLAAALPMGAGRFLNLPGTSMEQNMLGGAENSIFTNPTQAMGALNPILQLIPASAGINVRAGREMTHGPGQSYLSGAAGYATNLTPLGRAIGDIVERGQNGGVLAGHNLVQGDTRAPLVSGGRALLNTKQDVAGIPAPLLKFFTGSSVDQPNLAANAARAKKKETTEKRAATTYEQSLKRKPKK